MLKNIQLLRFIAAFAIVLYHGAPAFPFRGDSNPISWIGLFGFSGVDVFFVISGFIMWYTTCEKSGAGAASIFIRRRFARIYSGYWPYLLIGVLIFVLFDDQVLAQKSVVESFLLTPIPVAERVIPVSWTLTYELYFYLLFCGMLLFPQEKRQRFVLVFFGALFALNVIGVLFLGFHSQSFFSSVPVAVRVLISPYVLEFLAGCLVCQIHLNNRTVRKPFVPLLASIGLFCAGAAYNAFVLEGTIATGYHVAERVLFFGSASVLLVYGVAALDRLGIVFIPSLSQVLGGASYSIYLSHTLIYSLFSYVWGRELLKGEYVLPIAVVVIVVYSIIHYKWIEQPLYTAMKRWLGVAP